MEFPNLTTKLSTTKGDCIYMSAAAAGHAICVRPDSNDEIWVDAVAADNLKNFLWKSPASSEGGCCSVQ